MLHQVSGPALTSLSPGHAEAPPIGYTLLTAVLSPEPRHQVFGVNEEQVSFRFSGSYLLLTIILFSASNYRHGANRQPEKTATVSPPY
ncbi:hypothetical protein E2C01_102261 [Portunus trituberculatus]|uniref:Uncharacterized protein n=1 Tax=Portunus trituberculatus TaxID=210409 RepID=A0A5B7KI33_PORTR|nr:hypothetical protein [Portunus trituberculatus]